jgi:hypothetical protein
MKSNMKKLIAKKNKQMSKIFQIFWQDRFVNIPWAKFVEFNKTCDEMSVIRFNLIKHDHEAIKSGRVVDFKEYSLELLSEITWLKSVETELKRTKNVKKHETKRADRGLQEDKGRDG